MYVSETTDTGVMKGSIDIQEKLCSLKLYFTNSLKIWKFNLML